MNQKYICDICSRSFSSPAKLGGHKSSHNRYKGMILAKRGLSYNCKNCNKDITSEARLNRPRKYCNVNCMKEYRLKNNILYGRSLYDISEYRKTQQVCEICGLEEKAMHNKTSSSKLSVDHDHNTGEFRGLLCSSCNRNLGWAENNLASILTYIKYIPL